MRPMLRFWNHISYPTWEKLEEAVRTGQGQAKFGGFSEQQQQIFSQGVESFSAGTAAALPNAYDFGRHRRVLDVGGGTGSFLLAILQHHKNLTGTLFELPGACAVARQRLAKTPERHGARNARAQVACQQGSRFRVESAAKASTQPAHTHQRTLRV